MMDTLYAWLQAFAGLWTAPFYYAALLFVLLRVRRQTSIERKLFAVKLHSWWSEWWRIALWGAVAGVGASIVFLFLGAAVTLPALSMLWIIALLLAAARVRFLCFAYAAGVLGLAQAALSGMDAAALPSFAGYVVGEVQAIHLPSLFALVGVLHLAEAALVRAQAARLATPLFFEGKRGKPVGGYQLQGYWPVPLLLLVPFGFAAGGVEAALPWPTLFDGAGAGAGLSAGWAALAFPVLIGFHSVSLAQGAREKARGSALRLAGYGLAVTAAAIVLHFVPVWWMAATVSLLCFGLHELLVALDRREEAVRAPYFVHDGRGLKVLAVVPGSPAAELGIEPGHVLRKVNGAAVRDRAQLHAAMRQNAAFMKLEVLNLDGESRFLQRAMYANEHHQLGIVLCPDERTMYVASFREGGLFSMLRSKRSAGVGWSAAEAAAGREPLALPAPSTASAPEKNDEAASAEAVHRIDGMESR